MNLYQGEKIQGAKFIGQTKDPNGETVSNYNENPLFKSMLYDVDFPDGEIKEYGADILADNMYAKVWDL